MFEKIPIYPSQENLKSEEKSRILNKINKAVRVFVATGVLTMGAQPMLENKFIEGYNTESYVTYSGEDNEIQQEKMRENLQYLENKYSTGVVSFLNSADKEAKEKGMEINRVPKVIGFEKLNIDNDELKNLWSENFYPKGTINGEISEINYLDKTQLNVEEYNIKGEKAAGTVRQTKIIDFSKTTDYGNKTETLEALDWYFSHELGHLNDWSSKINLTSLERVEFLKEVTELFEEEDSFRDTAGYIDSINNPDKYKELYCKVTEYWATLCEYYLSFSEGSKIMSEKELSLIKKWLLRGENDSFNVSESIEGRNQLISRANNEMK